MTDLDLIQRQLDRILGFFPRIEGRINGLFAVDAVLLLVAATNLSPGDLKLWYVILPLVGTLTCLAVSLYHLFRANFPHDADAPESFIFYKEIQKLPEDKYIEAFRARQETDMVEDLLAQVWRNSYVLCQKYTRIKKAIIATTIGVASLVILLVITSLTHGRVPLLQAG